MSNPDQALRTEDAHWVRRAQAGNASAFAELVRRCRTAVYAVAYARLRDHDEAEDAAQEAFMTAHAKLGALREPDRFCVWVCRIAAHVAGRRHTQRQHDTERLARLASQSAANKEIAPWAALANGELSEAVRGLVQELSQANREAIELYYLRGYSIDEIAKFLDAPVGTIKRRLHDGREKLRAILLEALDPELLKDFLPDWRNHNEP